MIFGVGIRKTTYELLTITTCGGWPYQEGDGDFLVTPLVVKAPFVVRLS
jgi:hypothetical protein